MNRNLSGFAAVFPVKKKTRLQRRWFLCLASCAFLVAVIWNRSFVSAFDQAQGDDDVFAEGEIPFTTSSAGAQRPPRLRPRNTFGPSSKAPAPAVRPPRVQSRWDFSEGPLPLRDVAVLSATGDWSKIGHLLKRDRERRENRVVARLRSGIFTNPSPLTKVPVGDRLVQSVPLRDWWENRTRPRRKVQPPPPRPPFERPSYVLGPDVAGPFGQMSLEDTDSAAPTPAGRRHSHPGAEGPITPPGRYFLSNSAEW